MKRSPRGLRSSWRLASVVTVLSSAVGGCAALSTGPSTERVIPVEIAVRGGDIGGREARFELAAPSRGTARFFFARCEWAGSGSIRIDRACVGSFEVRTACGALRGPARVLFSGYGRLLALHGTVREGTGCFAGVRRGEIWRDGPVSFPTLPLRARLVVAGRADPFGAETPLHPERLALGAHAADPRVSLLALRVLADALTEDADETRTAAAVAIGFAASDPVYAAFREALAGRGALQKEAEAARELRAASPPTSRCEGAGATEGELATLCAAAARGHEAGRVALEQALGSGSRTFRREAAALLVRRDGAAAVPLLERALARALAAGERLAAIDLAEALLLAGGR